MYTEWGDSQIPSEALYEALASRIQSGDPAAEEEVVRLFHRRVRAFGLAHAGDADLAEELAQETLWGAIRALREGRVNQPAQLPAFVLGIARNLLNDNLRNRAREKREPLSDDMPFARPAAEHQQFERLRAARQAIDQLDPHERDVLLLGLLEGLKPEEIATRLGLTHEAVRQRKSRALKKLAELLRPVSQTVRGSLLKGVGR